MKIDPMTEPVVALPAPIALALGARLAPRPVLEAMIEQMIAALDAVDGDPDFELNGDEEEDSEQLQLGIDERGRWCDGGPFYLAPGDCDDAEQECEHHPAYGIDQSIMLAAPPARPGAYERNLNGWTR